MSFRLGPWSAWFALSSQAARMCWDAQAVMLLRSLHIAQGGAQAKVETTRMITEKVAALAEAQMAATAAALRGSKKHRVAKRRWGFMRSELAATGAGSGSNGALGLRRED
jgi:hypothetical protein